MTVEELKKHFKIKEDNHAKMQLQHAEQQQLEGLKKCKSTESIRVVASVVVNDGRRRRRMSMMVMVTSRKSHQPH